MGSTRDARIAGIHEIEPGRSMFDELGLAAVVGLTPLCRKPSAFLQPMPRRVKRPLLHLQNFLGDLKNAL